jgi:CheY-like chemotaxis protein
MKRAPRGTVASRIDEGVEQVVLVVEDNPEDYETTVRAFQGTGSGCTLRRCEDGEDALEYLFERSRLAPGGKEPVPALILLDLNLPGTDGREVLSMLKGDKNARSIPVIILTTSLDSGDIDECYRSGANSYMQKSVDLPGFMTAIGALVMFWTQVAVLPTTTS